MGSSALCHTSLYLLRLGSGLLNSLAESSPFPWPWRLSLPLAHVSLLRQLHVTIGRLLLYFSYYLCFIVGEVGARWGESSSVRRKWTLISFTLYNAFYKSRTKRKEDAL